MKLYRNAEGKWVGTQAEAKNKNVIEVPVDKPGICSQLATMTLATASCG